MNNRIDEFNSMLEVSKEIPKTLDMDTIRKNTKRRAFRHRVMSFSRNVVIAAAAFLGVLTIGVNTSDAFAATVKKLPLIGQLAQVVSFNEGISDAVESDYGVEIGQKVRGRITDLEVSYVMADDKNLVLFVKAADDGKKYKGQIEVEKMIDTDTGEIIEGGYVYSDLSTNGEYTTLIYGWNHYSRNIMVDLKFNVYDDQLNVKESEVFSFHFSVGDKFEPKIYDVNRDYTFGKAKYHIGKVSVYPMSTEIYIKYRNEDEIYTRLLEFELLDENGEVRAATTNGITGRETEDGGYLSILESGYFAYEGELKLRIASVETIAVDRRQVTLNLDTLEFSDSHGKLKEITNVTRDGDEISFQINGDIGKFDNTFDYILDEKGEAETAYTGIQGDNHSFIFLDGVDGHGKAYINNNNEVTLIRSFPENIITPNVDIDLR